MTINLSSIEKVLTDFGKVVGDNFVSKLDSYTEIGISEQRIEEMRAKIHPLQRYWNLLQRDLEKSYDLGKFHLSSESFLVLQKITDITSISGIKGFEYLLDRFKNRNQFYSAAFEAFIASSYRKMGYEVEIIEETSEKTPDLRIKTKLGCEVFIECKLDNSLAIVPPLSVMLGQAFR